MQQATQERRVLVVDDETIIVSFLESLLASGADGFHIVTANRGQEALHKAREWRPHLVVLDINIPDGDGFEVCERLAASKECRHTIVLAMTSDSNPERVRRIVAAGARECLVKPFFLPHFRSRVERYADEGVERERLFASQDNNSRA